MRRARTSLSVALATMIAALAFATGAHAMPPDGIPDALISDSIAIGEETADAPDPEAPPEEGTPGDDEPDDPEEPEDDDPEDREEPGTGDDRTHDAVLPQICLSGDARVLEGDAGETRHQFDVVLARPSNLRVQADWYGTGPGGAGDYRADGGHLVFEPGETRKTITVTVLGDTAPEGEESYGLSLRDVVNATPCEAPGVRLAIVDDDAVPQGGAGGAAPGAQAGLLQTDTVQMVQRTRRVTKGGRVRLRLACPAAGPDCKGLMKVVAGPALVGRARLAISAGDTRFVHVKLDKRARRVLTHGEKVELTLFKNPATGSDGMVQAGLLVFEICVNAANRPVTQLSPALAAASVACLINKERAKAGLPPLRFNVQLAAAASGHAAEGARLKWWGPGADSHTNPETGSTPDQRIRAAGYCGGSPRRTSENTFTSYGTGGKFPPTPAGAVAWWMQSPGHRANILDPNVTEIGVGVVPGSAMPGASSPPAGTFVTTFGAC
jgi:uncharacterized protein YkwD